MNNRDSGVIEVTILSDNSNVKITFRDDGPGYPDNVLKKDLSSANIGFDLIFGIVNQSMNGTVELENRNGAVAAITFENELINEVGGS